MRSTWQNSIFFLGCLLLVSLAYAGDWNETLKLSRRVTDLTQTLSESELSALETKLQEFERATSTQLVVVVVPTIGETSVDDAALKVAEANRIGQKEKNNGVLLFVAKNDRRLKIEVGYGLEGALPDALAGQIIRKEIVPWFRQGNYYAGIDAGVEAIIAATRNEYKADKPKSDIGQSLPAILLIGLFLFFFLIARGRRSRFIGGLPFYYSGWGGFPRSGGGGWGGGGSGGGFSGGGGSFGGGGASGGW